MPRRAVPAEPKRADLSIQQMKSGIARLEKRVEELEAFDPQSIQKRWGPEVKALQAGIEETLESVFGHNTPAFNRYRAATKLDNGPVRMRSDFAPGRHFDDPREAQQYVTEGKHQSIQLLRQAIRGLRETLSEQEQPALADVDGVPNPSVTLDKAQSLVGKVTRIEKTVFISYRRLAVSWAQSIFQDLTHHGYDVFFDFHGIASGSFEDVILENIKARAHFLVLLTPSAFERCGDATDLFRREIETAISVQRNIVPIMLEGFDFGAPGIDGQLGATLAALKQYNGLPVYAAYFTAAMDRLRQAYLNLPLDTVLHPVSPSAERVSKDEQAAAAGAPVVTEKELREAAQPRYVFTVQIPHEDELERAEGTRAEEPYGPGSLTLYDGDSVVARYPKVQRWSRQQLQLRTEPSRRLETSQRQVRFDVVADFSIGSNPSAFWSYGYSHTLGGQFVLHASKQFDIFPGVDRWASAEIQDIGVMHNRTGTTVPGKERTYTIPPDMLLLHPGAGGIYDVVRWSCRQDGQYSIEGLFCGLDTQTDTADIDVCILVNSKVLPVHFNTMHGIGTKEAIALEILLNAGDTLDFVVGVGPKRSHGAGSTGLTATITLI
jgi:hypothetical protein